MVGGEQDRPLVAFESSRLSYTDRAVDLYNSGVNQLLSLAAARGHALRHFRMADLYHHGGIAMARTTVLELEGGWEGDALDAWQHVRSAGTENVELAGIDLCFVRGDDIRHEGSPNVDILRTAERDTTIVESMAATLSTCDKFELVVRCPDVPQPITHHATELDAALDAAHRLPDADGWFVLKDRYGYGCGAQVHRLRLDTPGIEHTIDEYLRAYRDVLLQEYRPEVVEGDLVATFLGDELVGAMRRVPADDEWKTNASLGADQMRHELTPEQAETARAVRRAFGECRMASVDLLTSGQVIEINAFPGADGLLRTHGIVLGELFLDRLETELGARPEPSGSVE